MYKRIFSQACCANFHAIPQPHNLLSSTYEVVIDELLFLDKSKLASEGQNMF